MITLSHWHGDAFGVPFGPRFAPFSNAAISHYDRTMLSATSYRLVITKKWFLSAMKKCIY